MKVGKDCNRLPKEIVESLVFQNTCGPIGHCPEWPALVDCALGSGIGLHDCQGSILTLDIL